MTASEAVVVIAGSITDLGAVTRLIHWMPARFPVPLVAHVHGLGNAASLKLRQKAQASTGLHVVTAATGDQIRPGCLFLAPAGQAIVFEAPGLLQLMPDEGPQAHAFPADRLFESAARFHGSAVVGVVLGGQGRDGTQGLRVISEAGGRRVVQSPCEAAFPAMPINALMGDNVEHAVMLDQMGELLLCLVNSPLTATAEITL
jgi:two-component system chemotaxis response regulator CheB